MKTYLIALAASAAQAQLCTGDWYYGFQDSVVQYSNIDFGFKQPAFVVGGHIIVAGKQCAYLEYFDQDTAATPTNVWHACDATIPYTNVPSLDATTCQSIGGTSSATSCKFSLTGIQNLVIDQEKSDIASGFFKTDAKILIAFGMHNQNSPAQVTVSTIQGFEVNYSVSSANQQIQRRNIYQLSSIITHDLTKDSYIYRTDSGVMKEMTKYTNPKITWKAIAYSYKSEENFLYIGTADFWIFPIRIKTVYLMKPNGDNNNGLSNPDCLVNFLALNPTFQTNFGTIDYDVAGAVAFEGNNNVVIVLHTKETNKPIVIAASQSNANDVCHSSLKVELMGLNSSPAKSYLVQDVTQDQNNDKRAVILAKETATGLLEVFSITLQTNLQFTSHGVIVSSFLGSTSLQTSIGSLTYHHHNRNLQIFLFGLNNFGISGNEYGFLIRQPQISGKTCLSLTYSAGFIKVEKIVIQATSQFSSPVTQLATPVPSFQIVSSVTSSTVVGIQAKNPCSLKLAFSNPVTDSDVCQVSLDPIFQIFSTYQKCPFGTTVGPNLSLTLQNSEGVVQSDPTNQLIQGSTTTTQTSYQCKATAASAGQYTMNLKLDWTVTGASVTTTTPYKIITALPSTPQAPQTVTNSNTSVTISWLEPDTQGQKITSYTVLIKTKVGTFTSDLQNCDGSQATIRQTRTCTVPISTLMAAPFSLEWGSQVYATVSVTTLSGSSATSSPGSGAQIVTNPSAPVSLSTAAISSGSYQLAWYAGASNGGSNIIGYQIWQWDSVSNQYAQITPDVTSSPYTTQVLNPGTTYKYKITAQNSFGKSSFSYEKSIQIPQTVTPNQSICDYKLISTSVAQSVGNRVFVPTDQIKSYQVIWTSFLITLNQNATCQASVSYSVNMTVLQGDVQLAWFTINTAARQVFFQPQGQFIDSQVRIEITGRINDDISLAHATDSYLFSISNKVQFYQSLDIQEKQKEIQNQTQQIETITSEWKPPQKLKQQENNKPLYSEILSIDSKGIVKIGFSQMIMTPKHFQNLTQRQKSNDYFEIIQNLLKVKVNPQNEVSNSNYSISSVNISAWEPTSIEIKVQFTYPDRISKDFVKQDQLEVQITNSEFFVQIGNYERVQNRTSMKYDIPPQLSARQQEQIEFLESTASTGFTVVASSNLVLNIFLSSGLKQMWGLINVLQFLVFITKWKLDFPANALSVMQFIKMIALMEFLPTNWFTDILSKWFGIKTGSKDNILENMGMMLLIGCSVAVVVVVVAVSSVLMMLNYKIYKAFKMIFAMIFFNAFIRYVLQSTLKLQIGSLTTIESYLFKHECLHRCLEQESQGEFQIYAAWFIVIVLTVMPLIALCIVHKNYKNLDRPSMVQKIGSLYLGIKTNVKWAALGYTPIFLLRRLIFVAISFALSDKPYLQVHLFIYMLLWYVIYIEMVLPHETRLQTTFEHVNEALLLLICYHFVIWTGPGPEIDVDTKLSIGWSCVSFIGTLVILNALWMLGTQLMLILRKYKLWKLKKKQEKMIKDKKNKTNHEITSKKYDHQLHFDKIELKSKQTPFANQLKKLQTIGVENQRKQREFMQESAIDRLKKLKPIAEANSSSEEVEDLRAKQINKSLLKDLQSEKLPSKRILQGAMPLIYADQIPQQPGTQLFSVDENTVQRPNIFSSQNQSQEHQHMLFNYNELSRKIEQNKQEMEKLFKLMKEQI